MVTDKTMVRVGSPLPPRELEALEILATGVPAKTAARRMGISYQTLKNHVSTAYHRLGVTGHVEAFVKLGWLKVRKP